MTINVALGEESAYQKRKRILLSTPSGWNPTKVLVCCAVVLISVIVNDVVTIRHDVAKYENEYERVVEIRRARTASQLLRVFGKLEHFGIQTSELGENDYRFVRGDSGQVVEDRTVAIDDFQAMLDELHKLLDDGDLPLLEDSIPTRHADFLAGLNRIRDQLNSADAKGRPKTVAFVEVGMQVKELLESSPGFLGPYQLPKFTTSARFLTADYKDSTPPVKAKELFDSLLNKELNAVASLGAGLSRNSSNDSATMYKQTETVCRRDRLSFFVLALMLGSTENPHSLDGEVKGLVEVQDQAIQSIETVVARLVAENSDDLVLAKVHEHLAATKVRRQALSSFDGIDELLVQLLASID